MDYEIQLSQQTIDKLTSSSVTDKELLKMLAMEILSDRPGLLTPLDSYRTDKMRGSILEDTIAIEDGNISLESDMTGTVYLEFDEDIYYGCKDLDGSDDVLAEIPFKIDLKHKTLTLQAADEDIREPDEY